MHAERLIAAVTAGAAGARPEIAIGSSSAEPGKIRFASGWQAASLTTLVALQPVDAQVRPPSVVRNKPLVVVLRVPEK